VPVDVRILSATHRNLRELVAAGQFREDLFYRVDVIELHVPPLRDRREDVPALTDFLLQRLSADHGIDTPELTDAARDKLSGYDFPGNVRELENILERAVALSGDGPIGADDIQTQVAAATAPAAPNRLGDKLETVERDTIVKALKEARYNKTAAARALGLTLRALRYRMQKLGID
ncbi:MAG: helix-turn-helix domain-containing protein, partial [Gammaproteobacteria bacterium]